MSDGSEGKLPSQSRVPHEEDSTQLPHEEKPRLRDSFSRLDTLPSCSSGESAPPPLPWGLRLLPGSMSRHVSRRIPPREERQTGGQGHLLDHPELRHIPGQGVPVVCERSGVGVQFRVQCGFPEESRFPQNTHSMGLRHQSPSMGIEDPFVTRRTCSSSASIRTMDSGSIGRTTI